MVFDPSAASVRFAASSACSRFRRLDESREGVGVTRGKIGERLAVQFYSGLSQAGHESAIGNVVQARGGIDADDPETPVVALLLASPNVRKPSGSIDGLLGRSVELAFRQEKALGEVKYLLAPLTALASTFDSRHVLDLGDDAAKSGRSVTLMGGDEARVARRPPSFRNRGVKAGL
jgi:hypothetical protein